MSSVYEMDWDSIDECLDRGESALLDVNPYDDEYVKAIPAEWYRLREPLSIPSKFTVRSLPLDDFADLANAAIELAADRTGEILGVGDGFWLEPYPGYVGTKVEYWNSELSLHDAAPFLEIVDFESGRVHFRATPEVLAECPVTHLDRYLDRLESTWIL